MEQTKIDKIKPIWHFFRFLYFEELNPVKLKNYQLKYYKFTEIILNCKTNNQSVYRLYLLCCLPSVFAAFYFLFLFFNKENEDLGLLNIAKMFSFDGNIYFYFAILALLGLFLHTKLYLNIDPYILNSQQMLFQNDNCDKSCLFFDKYKQQTPRAYISAFLYKLSLVLQLFLSINSKISFEYH